VIEMDMIEINSMLQHMSETNKEELVLELWDEMEEERQQYERHMQMYACYSHDQFTG